MKAYKEHKIIKTNTTTDVYISCSYGYRKAVRQLYRVEGLYDSGPAFTTIKEAKRWITSKIEKGA